MTTKPSRLTTIALAAILSTSPFLAQDKPVEAPKVKPPIVQVIRLQHAVADEVVSIAQKLLGDAARRGASVMSDPRTNSLIISADEATIAEITRTVSELDIEATHGKTAAARRPLSYEVVLFMLNSGAEEALKLPRTSTGVIDPADAEGVLAKVREGAGKGSVTEVAKLSLMADDGKPWKSRQLVQVPVMSNDKGTSVFTGMQEAVMEFGISPEHATGVSRRLGVSCRIERFAPVAPRDPGNPDAPARPETNPTPPTKLVSTIEFSVSADDGKLIMASIQSCASRTDQSCLIFIRVKG